MIQTEVQVLKIFETRVSTIEWRADGILKITMKPNAHVEIADSKKIFSILKSLSSGKKDMLVVVITSEGNTTDKEVREFSTSDEASQFTIGEAIVTTSLAHRLFVNFMLSFHKPKRHLKMFSSEEQAIDWLYSLDVSR